MTLILLRTLHVRELGNCTWLSICMRAFVALRPSAYLLAKSVTAMASLLTKAFLMPSQSAAS